jgi:hypothetical protein
MPINYDVIGFNQRRVLDITETKIQFGPFRDYFAPLSPRSANA